MRGRDGGLVTSGLARMRIFVQLSPYLLPLFVVFWAEYACQSGAFTSFALPDGQLHSKDARVHAYQFYNLMYQVSLVCTPCTPHAPPAHLPPWCARSVFSSPAPRASWSSYRAPFSSLSYSCKSRYSLALVSTPPRSPSRVWPSELLR